MPFIRFIRVTTFETDNFSHLCDMEKFRKDRNEYRDMGKGYYHLCTDGWKDGNIFNNVAQFAYGMVLMGLICIRFSLEIYDFSLMPNHIHIILSGTGNDAVEAFLYLKRKLNIRLVSDGYKPLPEDYGFKLIPIKNEDQMRANILYLDRNHYEKLMAVPGGYPWCSSYLTYSLLGKFIDGKKVKDMTVREILSWTGSKTELPPDWQFHPVLGLLPSSFVNMRLGRKLFKTPKDYTTRLVKDYESFAKIAHSIDEEIEYQEQDVEVIVSSLLQRNYHGKPVSRLDGAELGRLTVTLNSQYNVSPEHIAGTLGISLHIVNQFLRAKDFKQ